MVNDLYPVPEPASDAPGLTLGSVLCGDASVARTPETEWVGLLQAIATGDQLALRDLYDRMHALVFTLIVRIVRDDRTAEELTLDVFHDVWKSAGAYSAQAGTVVSWLMMQARSRAIDRIRFEHRKKRVNPFPQFAEPYEDDSVSTGLDARQRHRQLRAAVAQLTPNERNAIELAFFSDFTYVQTAAHLHEPAGTVKTRIRSGLEKLRVALANQGPE